MSMRDESGFTLVELLVSMMTAIVVLGAIMMMTTVATHNQVRIAEEWSIVDNLSAGRVGISFASGWQPNDFVLAPENFADRKNLMFAQIETVQRLSAR